MHVSSASPDEFEIGAEIGPGVGSIQVGDKLQQPTPSPTGVSEHLFTLELDSTVKLLARWPRSGETLEDVPVLMNLADSCLMPSQGASFTKLAWKVTLEAFAGMFTVIVPPPPAGLVT